MDVLNVTQPFVRKPRFFIHGRILTELALLPLSQLSDFGH